MKKISNIILSSFLLVSFSLFNSSVFAAIPSYELVDLGLQESDHSEALAVNDNGQVVGIFHFLGDRYYFLWDAEKGVKLLDLSPDVKITVFNNAGQIAGQYGPQNNLKGFFWDPAQGFIDLGTFGGKDVIVNDMNDLGQIVGNAGTLEPSSVYKNGYKTHAFLWQNGNMIDLGTLSGEMGLYGDYSMATSINNAGIIVGRSTYGMVHKAKLMQSPFKGVIWRDGVIESLAPEFNGRLLPIYINDGGLVTSESDDCPLNLKGLCVSDLSAGKTWRISGSIFQKINENGSVLGRDSVYFSKQMIITSELRLACHFKEIAKFPWKELYHVNNFNNKNWIVGSARNIYGEVHAILFRPTE